MDSSTLLRSPFGSSTLTIPWREVGITLSVWAVVGVVGIGLRTAARVLSGLHPTLPAVAVDAIFLAMWALATPLILRSAARWPVATPQIGRRACAHLVAGTAFIVGTNLLFRLPVLWANGLSAMLSGTMLGVAMFYPAGIVSYGVIVALGQRLHMRRPDVEVAVDPSSADTSDTPRLVLREWNRIHFVVLDDIEWVEADNNHVVVHTKARIYKSRERLTDVEARVDARRFVRVHRSALVHVARIREVQPLMRGDQAIILESGRVVRVARSRRQALAEALRVPL